MSQPDIQGFLQNLDRSRLLGSDKAEEVWRKVGAMPEAETFAAWLVQQGTVTRYQADKLLRGSTRFFLDDYKLMDLIGTGRMAGVYRAVHKLGMPVAVKILPPSGAKKPEVLTRFQREAELALKLDDPRVVKTYHAGVSDGLHYIAMEFLEGETLEERLKEKGKLPPDEVLRFADQALQALDHIWEKGMVHRDIKPGNFMLVSLPGGATREKLYTVKLLDVGLGRALFVDEEGGEIGQDLTAAGDLIGTPDYTAPEQTRDSHAADIRSDMYSLGCTLYECLAGRVPFPDKNTVNKLIKHAKEMPPPLKLDGYPQAAELQAWLWKLMAKSPAERFQFPAEASAALHKLLHPKAVAADIRPVQPSAKVAAKTDPTATPPSAPNRKWKFAAIGSGAFALLILGSYLLISALSGPSKQTKNESPGKEVAGGMLPDETQVGPKEKKREGKVPSKKGDADPKVLDKKPDLDPKAPEKKTDPDPVIPPKKADPEVPAKKIEPEVPEKKDEVKKDPVVAVAPPDERLPMPSAEEIAKAEAVVRGVLKNDYAKTKSAERLALATKLLEEAGGTKDPAARYVMIRDSRNIAASLGNANVALAAAHEMANEFQISPGKASAAAADLIAALNLTPALATDATELFFNAADAARGADDWPSAVALARAAELAARKSQSAVLAAMAQTKLKEAETMKAEADKAKDHFATLKTKPDDPEANLAAGRFYGLIKQEWEVGIAMLAKGSNEQLKAAAENDLKAGTGNEEDRTAAGDSWYELVRTADPSAKYAMQTRAHFWYSLALPALTGLDKIKVEKRVAELHAVLEARGGKMKLWMANRQAVVEGKTKRWDLVGGSEITTGKEFEYIPKDGAILIGFNYALTAQGNIEALQPIFQSPRGEIKGTIFGVIRNKDAFRMNKAKPGYAIGALYIRASGAALLSLKPVYMKFTDKGLDPNNRYVGPLIGGDDTQGVLVGGDGNFFVGIRGKTALDNKVGALSAITLSIQEPIPESPDPKKK